MTGGEKAQFESAALRFGVTVTVEQHHTTIIPEAPGRVPEQDRHRFGTYPGHR